MQDFAHAVRVQVDRSLNERAVRAKLKAAYDLGIYRLCVVRVVAVTRLYLNRSKILDELSFVVDNARLRLIRYTDVEDILGVPIARDHALVVYLQPIAPSTTFSSAPTATLRPEGGPSNACNGNTLAPGPGASAAAGAAAATAAGAGGNDMETGDGTVSYGVWVAWQTQLVDPRSQPPADAQPEAPRVRLNDAVINPTIPLGQIEGL